MMKRKHILILFSLTLAVIIFILACADKSLVNNDKIVADNGGGDNGGGYEPSEPEFAGPFKEHKVSAQQCTSSLSTLNCFISVWNTENTGGNGVSDDRTVKLPLVVSGTQNSYVDWGDGSDVERIIKPTDGIHEYDAAGEYTIYIAGELKGWRFYSSTSDFGDAVKLVDVKQWGSLSLGNTAGRQFQGAKNFNPSATDAPDLSETTDLTSAFENATIFNGEIGNWNVSQVTSMSGMFRDAKAFNQDISGWNVEEVTIMDGMFFGTSSFNNNGMPLTWGDNTRNVRSTVAMFREAEAFNQDISGWNVEQVTSMKYMFNYASNFNNKGEELKWGDKTSKVTNMSDMFDEASNFNQDISEWDVEQVTDYDAFSKDSGLLIEYIPVKFRGPGNVSKQKCTGSNPELSCFIIVWNTTYSRNGASSKTNIVLPLVSNGDYDFYVKWDDDSKVQRIKTFDDPKATHTYATPGEYTIYIAGEIKGWSFHKGTDDYGDAVKLLDVKQWGPLSLGNTAGNQFIGANNFVGTATDKIGLRDTRDLSYVFYSAKKFNGAIGNWDVSRITNMQSAFENAEAFNQDIGGWTVSRVNNMQNMFLNAFGFNKNICRWNILNVKNKNSFATNSSLEYDNNPFYCKNP